MKKQFIYLMLAIAFIGRAQTNPSYKTIKITAPETGTVSDDVVVRSTATGGVLKILPVSQIKGTTNLDFLATPTGGTIFSSTGIDAVIALATETNAGLLSPAEKTKLSGLQSALDTKVDKATGKSLLSDSEIARLATLNNYTHPANHQPSIITQDANNRFVTDAEKATWNAKQSISQKNTANGYAGLGSDGKLISSQLPSITISDTFVTANQAAMLAVTAETGDVVVRTDLNKSFILKGINPTVLADWQELLSPTSAVTTVFGRNGAISAQIGDYTADQITETANRKFQTANQNTNNNAASPIQGQLDNKEPLIVKNTAFNKNFGTTAGTVAEGNDSRILNGQTAFGWGNHAGKYPLYNGTGATGTWGININGISSGVVTSVLGTGVTDLVSGTMADNDFFRIRVGGTASNAGFAEIATADDGNEPIYVRQYTGTYTTITRTATLLDGNGNTSFPGDVIAFSSSDKRLKDNIIPIKTPLEKINKIGGYTFDWNSKQDTYKGHDVGVVAQEIEAVLPELVVTRENGYKAVKYDKLVALLIEGIKAQQKEITELKKQVRRINKKLK
jgi:hypothetical protein